jgi:hypothetical protein
MITIFLVGSDRSFPDPCVNSPVPLNVVPVSKMRMREVGGTDKAVVVMFKTEVDTNFRRLPDEPPVYVGVIKPAD